MKYHPDRNKSKDATRKFIEIKEAYEELFKYDPNPQLMANNVIFIDPYQTYGTTGTTFTFTTTGY